MRPMTNTVLVNGTGTIGEPLIALLLSLKKKLGIDSDIISVKLWNPYGYKLVSKDSGIEEENYRVNYHRLTGDIMKIYDFMVDYTEGSPGSAEYYITSGLIKD